jgi:uncharacterized small protein (DUF1192 family)
MEAEANLFRDELEALAEKYPGSDVLQTRTVDDGNAEDDTLIEDFYSCVHLEIRRSNDTNFSQFERPNDAFRAEEISSRLYGVDKLEWRVTSLVNEIDKLREELKKC